MLDREWEPGSINRARQVQWRAGGKGNNVARTVRVLGQPVTAVGFYGGPTGLSVRSALEAGGIPLLAEPARGDTRTCLTIVAGSGTITEIRDPGPKVEPNVADRLLQRLVSAVAPNDWVTLSGSLPQGLDADVWPRWIRALNARCRGVLVDTSGANLSAAASANPTLLVPNRSEWEEAQLELVRPLVITEGPAGVTWYPAEGHSLQKIRPPKVAAQNTVGAGDVLLGGLVARLAQGDGWEYALRFAVAAATASVTSSAVADFDPALAQSLVSRVTME